MLLEDAGMVTHVYNIYCAKNRTLLTTVKDKSQIPDGLYCRYCDKEHRTGDDFEVELAFSIVEQAWEPLPQNVAVR